MTGGVCKNVLVIGAGIAGIEASLLLSKAGRKVYLVEKCSFVGGTVVKFENVFPNMECATCMLAPRQQDLLQDRNIELLTLAQVAQVGTSPEGFTVQICKRARYVDILACIGCGTCYEPCPVSAPNEFEMGLSQSKAISIPCVGALPNVPVIDKERCVRFAGKDCRACKDACALDAINLDQKDEMLELRVGAIIVATGFDTWNVGQIPRYGYGRHSDIYDALEFERLFASNGPTEGRIVLRSGRTPRSAALVHCVGREEKGYCSAVCCLYLLKFSHYLKSKISDVKINEFYTDFCIPGKSHQRFFERMVKGDINLIRASRLEVDDCDNGLVVRYDTGGGKRNECVVDMVILAPPMQPRRDTPQLAKILGISLDDKGFFVKGVASSVSSSRSGIYVVGCAQGPKSIEESVAEAQAAVADILSSSRSGGL